MCNDKTGKHRRTSENNSINLEYCATSYPVYDCVEYSKSESGPPGQYLQ